jgi:hypothetical protein
MPMLRRTLAGHGLVRGVDCVNTLWACEGAGNREWRLRLGTPSHPA